MTGAGRLTTQTVVPALDVDDVGWALPVSALVDVAPPVDDVPRVSAPHPPLESNQSAHSTSVQGKRPQMLVVCRNRTAAYFYVVAHGVAGGEVRVCAARCQWKRCRSAYCRRSVRVLWGFKRSVEPGACS